MTNTLKLTPVAIEDIEYHKKSGNKPILRKLSVLLEEITENPSTGTGNPEEMKYNFAGCWSRRIIRQHRLVKGRLGSVPISVSGVAGLHRSFTS
jgi:toxin YoeB